MHAGPRKYVESDEDKVETLFGAIRNEWISSVHNSFNWKLNQTLSRIL